MEGVIADVVGSVATKQKAALDEVRQNWRR